MRSLIAAVRSLLSRTRFEREMREELAQHVQHRADDLVATGMPRENALRQARVEFGAVEACKEQCRDASGLGPLRLLHGFGADLRLAARRLLATPMFTIFAVVSLAIGVGVTTSVYSVVDNIFWQASGLHEPSSLGLVVSAEGGGNDGRWALSGPDFEDLRRSQQSFSNVAAS